MVRYAKVWCVTKVYGEEVSRVCRLVLVRVCRVLATINSSVHMKSKSTRQRDETESQKAQKQSSRSRKTNEGKTVGYAPRTKMKYSGDEDGDEERTAQGLGAGWEERKVDEKKDHDI